MSPVFPKKKKITGVVLVLVGGQDRQVEAENGDGQWPAAA